MGSEPACVVRFYVEGDTYRFEVDAALDPVKPWASGTAGHVHSCIDLAVPYVACSLIDSVDERTGLGSASSDKENA